MTLVGQLSEQPLGDDHPLDLVRALVDLGAQFGGSSRSSPVRCTGSIRDRVVLDPPGSAEL